MTILLSIRPQFVAAILAGEKSFEYRRIAFRRPVRRVLMYCTSPIKRIVGEFTVTEVIRDQPDRLWKLTRGEAGITKRDFYRYFSGVTVGTALRIGETHRYDRCLTLEECSQLRAPQSFVYLEDSQTARTKKVKTEKLLLGG